MIKKVVFVFETSLLENVYERFGHSYFTDAGYQVEYWSVAQIVMPGKDEDSNSIGKNISSFKELKKEIDKNSISVIYMLILGHDSFESNKIRYCIWRKGRRYCDFYRNPTLQTVYKISGIYAEKCNYGIHGYKEKIKNRLSVRKICNRYYQRKISPIYNFISTKSITNINNRLREQENRNVYLQTSDYEEAINVTSEKSDDIIVFIDQAMTHHREYSLFNIDNPYYGQEEKYYRELTDLFDHVEALYNKKVVIAAHPVSSYTGEEFDHRLIYYGETAKLIKNAALVITHTSTALNFAIIYKVPFLLVSTDELLVKPSFAYDYQVLECFWGLKVLNISRDEYKALLRQYIYLYNKEKYDEFFELCIKSKGSLEGPFFQNVVKCIDYNMELL